MANTSCGKRPVEVKTELDRAEKLMRSEVDGYLASIEAGVSSLAGRLDSLEPQQLPILTGALNALFELADPAASRDLRPHAVVAVMLNLRHAHHVAALLEAADGLGVSMTALHDAVRDRSMAAGAWEPMSNLDDPARFAALPLLHKYVAGAAVLLFRKRTFSFQEKETTMDAGGLFGYSTVTLVKAPDYHMRIYISTGCIGDIRSPEHSLLLEVLRNMTTTYGYGARSSERVLQAVFDDDSTLKAAVVIREAMRKVPVADMVDHISSVSYGLFAPIAAIVKPLFWEEFVQLCWLIQKCDPCLYTQVPLSNGKTVLPSLESLMDADFARVLDADLRAVAVAQRKKLCMKASSKEMDPGMYRAWLQSGEDVFLQAPLVEKKSSQVQEVVIVEYDDLQVTELVVHGRTWRLGHGPVGNSTKAHLTFLLRERPGFFKSEEECAEFASALEASMRG